jgi:hypothetical protein
MTGSSQALQATETNITGQKAPSRNAMQLAFADGLITQQHVQHPLLLLGTKGNAHVTNMRKRTSSQHATPHRPTPVGQKQQQLTLLPLWLAAAADCPISLAKGNRLAAQ